MSNEDYLKKGRFTTPMYTIPITEWYTSEDPLATAKQRISLKFLRERKLYKDHLNRALTRGWTRHPHDPEPSPKKRERVDDAGKAYVYPPPDGCGSCFYMHDSAPGIEFWYPIPSLDRFMEPTIPPQTQYIFCSTHKTYLYIRSTELKSKPHDRHVWLRDEHGAWAGTLLLHRIGDREFFKSNSDAGVRLELVAISRGHIASDERAHALVKMGHDERPNDAELYEFYNVLWVEWKAGVAYRKAHGRVLRDLWEKQDLDVVSLVLG